MLKPMRWMIIPSMLSFSTLAFAGGVPTDLPTGADSSGKTKTSTATAPTKASKAAKAKSMAAKKVAKKITKASAAKSKKAQQAQANSGVRSPAGFRAVEDEKLVIDSSQLSDGDGLGEVQYNGKSLKMAMTGWLYPEQFQAFCREISRLENIFVSSSYIDRQITLS